MGMTRKPGLPHNNRVGDLDAFALGTMMRTAGRRLEEAEKICAGSRGSKDCPAATTMCAIWWHRPRGKLAGRGWRSIYLAHQIADWIGAFIVNSTARRLVFTAGIGENQTVLRAAMCAGLNLRDPAGSRPNASQRGAEGAIGAAEPRSGSWSSRPTKNWWWRAKCGVTGII
jgi:acetate kinase